MSKQFTLGKTERLKSRKRIQQLFDEGKSFALSPYKIFYLFVSAQARLQVGFTVSTKNFKRAVDRNRIKRLTKEAYRLQKQILYSKLKENNQQLILFFIYTGKELPDYKLVYKKMDSILQKLILIADENNIAHS